MTITRISLKKSSLTESLIRINLLLVITISCIFCEKISVWAQNVVIQVYDAQSRVLLNNPLPINFTGMENDLSRPVQKELATYYAFLLDRISEPVFTKPGQNENKESANAGTNREVFKLLYNKPRINEKAALRQEWEEAFGFDVWLPYYKYKEIEKLVKNKFSVQVFKLKGEPLVEKDKILYVFAATF
jgi:hypothetical protein